MLARSCPQVAWRFRIPAQRRRGSWPAAGARPRRLEPAHSVTGLPLGDDAFVAQDRLGRTLRPRKPGPKPRNSGAEGCAVAGTPISTIRSRRSPHRWWRCRDVSSSVTICRHSSPSLAYSCRPCRLVCGRQSSSAHHPPRRFPRRSSRSWCRTNKEHTSGRGHCKGASRSRTTGLCLIDRAIKTRPLPALRVGVGQGIDAYGEGIAARAAADPPVRDAVVTAPDRRD